MKYILGKKIGMSQMFDKTGKITPVTLVSAGPCYVLQNKSKESASAEDTAGKKALIGKKDGYDAVQVGFEKIGKKSKIKKTMKGKEYKYIKEFRGIELELKVGDEINVSVFKEGDVVKVSGRSKGKGYQGGVKRHGFSTRISTHGQKHELRAIGSMGCRFPQHVRKGKKMPGRMGFQKIMVKNLKIMKVDPENNLLVVKGALPGTNKTLLEISN